MTQEEAISVIKTEIGQFIIDEKWKNALALAIEALKAQDSKTRRICDTCKHNPVSKKWPCVDCDMREPADRWERKDVPDTNVGDMIIATDLQFLQPESEYVFYDSDHGFCINTQDVLDCLRKELRNG